MSIKQMAELYEPSGPVLDLTVVYFGAGTYRMPPGRFQVLEDDALEAKIIPAIFIPGKEVLLLDCRAIVLNATTGEVYYTPRMYFDSQPQYIKDWLADYPEWGVMGCERDWKKARRKISRQ